MNYRRKGTTKNAIRFNRLNYPCPSSWIGTKGLSENTVREILQDWQADGTRYCQMDFKQPKHIARTFFTDQDDTSKFTPILIGKEVGQIYYKGAFRTTSGNIIMRTSHFGTNNKKNGSKNALFPGFTTQRNFFDADESFFTELKARLNQ